MNLKKSILVSAGFSVFLAAQVSWGDCYIYPYQGTYQNNTMRGRPLVTGVHANACEKPGYKCARTREDQNIKIEYIYENPVREVNPMTLDKAKATAVNDAKKICAAKGWIKMDSENPDQVEGRVLVSDKWNDPEGQSKSLKDFKN